MKNHIDLINYICEHQDLCYKVGEFLDYNDVVKIYNRKKQLAEYQQKRRWKRSSNHYDSYKYMFVHR